MPTNRLALLCTLLALMPGLTGAQRKLNPQLEVHNTIALPAAAHRVGEKAGFFIDPITGQKVYRLSDRHLCSKSATHIYSYTPQFSPSGRMVFQCDIAVANYSEPTFPVYNSDYTLLTKDLLGLTHFSGRLYGDMQWSEEREVVYGRDSFHIFEFDPVAKKSRMVVDFSKVVLRDPQERKVPLIGIFQFIVGAKDRMTVHLQTNGYAQVGVAAYDPATGKISVMYVPVPGDKAPSGFDEAHFSQNPKGRVTLVYGAAPNFSYSADLSSRVQYDDNHGHLGYFCGSNGRCYKVSAKNDNLPDGRAGAIGCRNARGEITEPWKGENALYDDETGKRVLIFGCDVPGEFAAQHFSRSLGVLDIFGISTLRYTFPGSLQKFYPADEAILRAVVRYAGTDPSRVTIEPLAYHRSAYGPRAEWAGRSCGYWATPRAAEDRSGTRFMFDSTMSHSEWPATENGQVKSDCRTDVYVVDYSEKK
jgi:hypothetical protein